MAKKNNDTITLMLTGEQALALKNILHAVGKTWRRYPGMNTGSSQVHNLYFSDLDLCFKLSDEIGTRMENA